MRFHKKNYEDIYSKDLPKNPNFLRFEDLGAEGMELDDYISLFKSFLTDCYLDLFFKCVKLSWLRRKFIFRGKKNILPMYKNAYAANSVFVKLLRRHVGKDLQVMTRNNMFQKLELYFDELFPRFEEENPFENPDYYKFPYKNISIDFMMVVYNMDERLELLEEADKQKMTFAVFLDYVINHALSENDFLGRAKYDCSPGASWKTFLCIKNNDRQAQSKKGQKRL